MKKRVFVYFFIFVLMVVLQMTVAPHIAILGVKPNFILTFVIMVGLLKGSPEGALIGLLLGIVLDTYSVTPFGTYALLLTLFGGLAGMFEKYAMRENYFSSMVFVFILTLLFEGISFAFTMGTLYWSNGFGESVYYIWKTIKDIILLEAVYNVAMVVILQFILGKLIIRLDERDSGFGGELTWQK